MTIIGILLPLVLGGTSAYTTIKVYDGKSELKNEQQDKYIMENKKTLDDRGVHLPKILAIIDSEDKKDRVLVSLDGGITQLNILLARVEERETARDIADIEQKIQIRKLADDIVDLQIKVGR
jgi:hypothetical protein